VVAIGLALTAGCAGVTTARFDPVDRAPVAHDLVAIPHQGAVGAARYDRVVRDTVMGTDSVWIYRSYAEGFVAHSVARDADGGQWTTWLEVDGHYRPLRGWERHDRGPMRCDVSFVVEDTLVQIVEQSNTQASGLRVTMHAPDAFGVGLHTVLADGWLVAAASATPTTLLALPRLTFGACGASATGFRATRVDTATYARRPVAGFDRSTLLGRWFPAERGRFGDAAPGRPTDALALEAETQVWLDPNTGIVVHAARRDSAGGVELILATFLWLVGA
jgi:hypothetical protein